MLIPKVNLPSHFSTLSYFKHGNLWNFLAPLLWKINMYIHLVFFRKFNS